MFCHICKKSFQGWGWARHVKAEKKKHGDNVYAILEARIPALEEF